MNKTRNLSDFFNTLKELKKRASIKLKKEDYSIFFRGESQDFGKTKCIPAIFRNESHLEKESLIFKEFLSLHPEEFINEKFINEKFTIDKLTKMQHYGLPTRLLDLSENALLALFMALSQRNAEKKDAIVYMFFIPKNKIKYNDSDTVSVIANLSKEPLFEIPLEKDKNKFNQKEPIKRLLNNIKDEKPYFENRIEPNHLSSIVCVRPSLNNKRII